MQKGWEIRRAASIFVNRGAERILFNVDILITEVHKEKPSCRH